LPLRDIQWVVIPFVLAQSSFALVFGHLGDRLGHRRVFALGLAASVVAHAAVALAADFPTLVGMRVLQGAAVGIAVSCAPALATLLFAPADKARVLVWYSAAFSLAMAVGPWLGGLLIQAFGWPGVFWFRAPLALLALLLLPLLPRVLALPSLSPSSLQSQSAGRPAPAGGSGFDWVGALGLAAVLSCLMLALAELTAPRDARPFAWPLLAVGVAGAVLFVRHESRIAHPVLRMEPFRSLRFSGIQAASVVINLACFGNLMLIPYVLTRDAGASIASAGLLLSAYPGGSVLGSLLAGRLARRLADGLPAALLMAIGLGGAAAGLLLTAAILFAWPVPWLLGASMLASGIGHGLFQVGYMDATTSMLPIEERGVAGSLVSVTRLLGIVLGATGIGWLQGLTDSFSMSFAVLGGGLGVFAASFLSADRVVARTRRAA
jgi:MFS family permease